MKKEETRSKAKEIIINGIIPFSQEEITNKAIEYSVENPGEFVSTPYFEQVGGLYSQTDIEWAFEEGAKWMYKTMLKRSCERLTDLLENFDYNE